MFESFYQFSGNPFRLTPDPRYFFPSRIHKRGLAYLRYGVEQGEGIIVVTGKPGTGKSTLVKTLIGQLDQQHVDVAELNTTQIGPDDMLRLVAASFGVAYEGASKASLLKGIETQLMKHARLGRRALLIIDEVQNLPIPALEELRMLSNLQFGAEPILQIFLVGQEEFREVLHSSAMDQLLQRVIAAHHLTSLEPEETRGYIEHRLTQVGWHGDPAISDEAYRLIHELTGDVPRRINKFCGRLFLHASLEELHEIGEHDVRVVQGELKGEAEATGVQYVGTEGGDVAVKRPPQAKRALDNTKPTAPTEGRATPASSEAGSQVAGDDTPKASSNIVTPRSFRSQNSAAVTHEEMVALTSGSNQGAQLRVVKPATMTPMVARRSDQHEPKPEVAVPSPATEERTQRKPPVSTPASSAQTAQPRDSKEEPVSKPQAEMSVQQALASIDKQKNQLVMKISLLFAVLALVVGGVIAFLQWAPQSTVDRLKEVLLITQLEQHLAPRQIEEVAPAKMTVEQLFAVEESADVASSDGDSLSSEGSLDEELTVIIDGVEDEPVVAAPEPAQTEPTVVATVATKTGVSEPLIEKKLADNSDKVIALPVLQPKPISSGPTKVVATIKESAIAKSEGKQAGNREISEQELALIAANLEKSYENGDWYLLAELFSTEKLGDSGDEFRETLKGYAELFQSTELRDLTMGYIAWDQLAPGKMRGVIPFTAKKRGNGAIIALLHTGMITIDVERIDGKVVITDFSQVFDNLGGH